MNKRQVWKVYIQNLVAVQEGKECGRSTKERTYRKFSEKIAVRITRMPASTVIVNDLITAQRRRLRYT